LAPLKVVDAYIGRTALHWACIFGRERIAKALLDGKYKGRGAEIDTLNVSGTTPLMFASLVGNEAVVRLLLARGAKVTTRNKNGNTALSLATQNGHAACTAVLRDAACTAVLRAHGATD